MPALVWRTRTLRDKGFDGRLSIVSEEPHLPYDRPPLSKKVLTGEAPPESTRLGDADLYRVKEIELRLATRAVSIDRSARQVLLSDGDRVPYDKLLIATGSRLRHLSMPGADLAGIHYLRGLDDCADLRAALRSGASVVIVGGGYIGLEVAASAHRLGCGVTVLEGREVVMPRAVAPEVGRWFERLHRDKGVAIRTGASVAGFGGRGGRVDHVVLADGEKMAADIVVVGVGILPNVELAATAGLPTDNGLVVDDRARTADPRIFAAGDVTNHPNALLGRRIRLEPWQNAQNQAMIAAAAMCGEAPSYAEIPWFWSDQHGVNLQIVGLPQAWDRMIPRCYAEGRSITFVYLRDGAIVGANAIDAPRDVAVLRRLMQARKAVDPAALADVGRPLRELLKA